MMRRSATKEQPTILSATHRAELVAAIREDYVAIFSGPTVTR
jgi:hypothetical protein